MRSVTNLDWVTCLAVTKVVFVHEGGRTGAVPASIGVAKPKVMTERMMSCMMFAW